MIRDADGLGREGEARAHLPEHKRRRQFELKHGVEGGRQADAQIEGGQAQPPAIVPHQA